MRRRNFILLVGGTAATWPLAARAQQSGGIRRIGVLVNLAADNSEVQARIGAFLQGLQEFGWSIGRNVRIEYRWASNPNDISRYAAELLALAPDVLLAKANPSMDALLTARRPLCLWLPLTQSALASSRACRGREETRLDS